MKLKDRTYAAFMLAEELRKYRNSGGVVLAVPRGGVPVGYHLARLLGLELDIVVSKKIGHPLNPELAVGAVSGSDVILEDALCASLPASYIQRETRRIKTEIAAKYKRLMNGRSPLPLKGRIVILTDDGIATGSTLMACIQSIRKHKPKKVIIAVPVASSSAHAALSGFVDDFVSLLLPIQFRAVGEFYENFTEVTDEEVIRLLNKSASENKPAVKTILVSK